MITILHGENTTQSRDALVNLIKQAKKDDHDIERLEAKSLNLASLEQTLGSVDLFGSNKTVVIEGLHSLPRSKKKSELIKLITSSSIPVILWEKRALTPTMIKQFPNSKAQEFKISKTLYQWIDSLSGQKSQIKKSIVLFHQTLQTEDAGLCWAMMARQIRLLIEIKCGGTPKVAPFMLRNLTHQAQHFELDQLISIHARLQEMDLRLKTSATQLTLIQELDLLMMDM